jgi:hypothetical protein
VRGSIVRVLRKRQDAFSIVDFTASFRNGKISGYGYTRFSKFQGEGGKFAITGGTGSYNDVRGASASSLSHQFAGSGLSLCLARALE